MYGNKWQTAEESCYHALHVNPEVPVKDFRLRMGRQQNDLSPQATLIRHCHDVTSQQIFRTKQASIQ